VRILELINFVNSRVPDAYYPNIFPTNSPDACVRVRLTGGFPTDEWTGKKQPSFQIFVRDVHPALAENRAYAIHESLTNLTNVTIGDSSVVKIRSNNSVPIYLGDDENNRPMYSMNFDCVVRP
jgi:Bacteriophage minor capsid protein